MNVNTEASEIRRQGRHPFTGRVINVDDRDSEFAALDLSPDGVGLLASKPLAAGQVVQLAFLDGSIVVKGYVRYVYEIQGQVWRVGIDFLQNESELAEVALALN